MAENFTENTFLRKSFPFVHWTFHSWVKFCLQLRTFNLETNAISQVVGCVRNNELVHFHAALAFASVFEIGAAFYVLFSVFEILRSETEADCQHKKNAFFFARARFIEAISFLSPSSIFPNFPIQFGFSTRKLFSPLWGPQNSHLPFSPQFLHATC